MTLALQAFTGLAYRAHHPNWSFTPLSGEGAKRHGGRFNPPGLPALYVSLDPTTAWMEAQQAFPFKPQPLTLVAYQIDCTRLIDLNNARTLIELKVKPEEMACAWEDLACQGQEPLTWRVAKQLIVLGVSGIQVRSYAPGCTEANQNLVFWHWSSNQPHRIQVIDDFGRLPRNQNSWTL